MAEACCLPRLCAFAIAGIFASSTASAELLTNGGFESFNTDPEPQLTFSNWIETSSDTNATLKNASALASRASEGESVISGTASAELVATTAGGYLGQNVTPGIVNFTLTLDFATLLPNLTDIDTDRYFSLIVKHGLAASAEQINLRVIKSGQLQTFGGAAWQNVGTLFATFTPDTGTQGTWETETPIVNTLTLTGEYDSTPTYNITLNGVTVSGLSFFQGTAPVNNDLTSIGFNANLAKKNFLVDNVSLVPEPTSAAMLFGAALPLLARRRRRPAAQQ